MELAFKCSECFQMEDLFISSEWHIDGFCNVQIMCVFIVSYHCISRTSTHKEHRFDCDREIHGQRDKGIQSKRVWGQHSEFPQLAW